GDRSDCLDAAGCGPTNRCGLRASCGLGSQLRAAAAAGCANELRMAAGPLPRSLPRNPQLARSSQRSVGPQAAALLRTRAKSFLCFDDCLESSPQSSSRGTNAARGGIVAAFVNDQSFNGSLSGSPGERAPDGVILALFAVYERITAGSEHPVLFRARELA